MAVLAAFSLLVLTWNCGVIREQIDEKTFACRVNDNIKGSSFTLCGGLQIDQPNIMIKDWREDYSLETCRSNEERKITLVSSNSITCENVPPTVDGCNDPTAATEATETTTKITARTTAATTVDATTATTTRNDPTVATEAIETTSETTTTTTTATTTVDVTTGALNVWIALVGSVGVFILFLITCIICNYMNGHHHGHQHPLPDSSLITNRAYDEDDDGDDEDELFNQNTFMDSSTSEGT